MTFGRTLRFTSLGVVLFWIACSASPGRETASSGGGGGDPGGTATGGATCPRCDDQSYVACGAAPVSCAPKLCSPTDGCVTCIPGSTFCSGNDVVACEPDGEATKTVETCDVGSGEVCSNGLCADACALAAGSPSNVGCEFWVVDLDNEYSQLNDAAGNPFGVVLSNVGEVPAKVVIERNDGAPGAPLQTAIVDERTINPGTLAEIELPVREVDGSAQGKGEGPGTFLSSNAYRVRSSAPLVAYQFNTLTSSFSNDASLLLPQTGLGTQYRVLGWPTANPIAFGMIPGLPDHSFVTIVGVEPGTDVTVTLGGPIVGGGGIPASGAGATVTATLGPFDVLNLESDKIPGDLTNTRVASTRPVAVFSGGERGFAPYNVKPPEPPSFDPMYNCCTDHLEEQVFPLTSLGTRFVASRSPIRSTGGYVESDIIRFLAVEPGTSVSTSLPPPNDTFTLGDGEMREIAVTVDFVATSSAPLIIGQYLVSQAWTEAPIAGGDPSFTVFPPIEQFRDRYQFLVPTSWQRNYVVVSGPAGTTFQIDGAAPGVCVKASAGSIDGTAYEASRCELSEGVHRVEASAPVGIVVYGYGNVGSYAFVGGADVKAIYEPPK